MDLSCLMWKLKGLDQRIPNHFLKLLYTILLSIKISIQKTDAQVMLISSTDF